MSSVSWVRQRFSRTECLPWHTYQKTSDRNRRRVLSPKDVLKIKDLGPRQAIFHAVRHAERVSVPSGKGRPNSKPVLVVLTAFLAPSKALAFGTHP